MLEQSRFVLELKAYLTNHWKEYNLSGSPATLAYRIRQAPLGRAIDKSRFVALWFLDDPEKPQVVTKWIPNKNLSPFVVQEHRHAKELYEARGLRFVPRPLDCPEILGLPVMIEEAVLGRSFAHQILSLPFGQSNGQARIEATYASMYEKAQNLLQKIQDPLTPIARQDALTYLNGYLEKTEILLEWSPQLSQTVRRTLEAGIPETVPGSGKTMLVGDFAPQNILEGANGIYLIDLEFSLESPLAFLDPLAFAYTLTRFSIPDFSREEISEAVRLLCTRLLSDGNSISQMARRFLEARGLSISHLPWYWLVFFIHEAAFQQFLTETLSPNVKRFFHSMIASLTAESCDEEKMR